MHKVETLAGPPGDVAETQWGDVAETQWGWSGFLVALTSQKKKPSGRGL